MSDNNIDYTGKPHPFKPSIGGNVERPFPARPLTYEGYHDLDNLKSLLAQLLEKTSVLASRIESELVSFNLKIEDSKLNTAHVIEWPQALGTPKDYISYPEYKALEGKNTANAALIRKAYENALRGPAGNTAIDILKMCNIFRVEANNIGEFLDEALGQIDDTAEFRTLELLQDWTENALYSTEAITNFYETRAQAGALPASELDQITSQRAAEYQAIFQVKLNVINKDIVQHLNEIEKNFISFSSVFYKKNLGPALKFQLNAVRRVDDNLDERGILAREAKQSTNSMNGNYLAMLSDQLTRNLAFERKIELLQERIETRETYTGYVKNLAGIGKAVKPVFTDIDLTDEEVEYYQNPPQSTGGSDTSSFFFGIPSDSFPGDVALEGTATSLSRSDHRHGREDLGDGGSGESSVNIPTITVAAADSYGSADYTCDDGITNDMTILEAWEALKAASPGGMGGRLLFLPGTYTISAPLDLDADSLNALSVWGYGARIIAANPDYPNSDFEAMVALSNSIDAEIRGLRVDGNTRAYSCIAMSNCERGRVTHCTALSARRSGFDINGNYVRVGFCFAKECGWTGYDLTNGTEAIGCIALLCGAIGQAALGGYDADGWGDGFTADDSAQLVACHAYECSVNGFSGRASATACYAYQNGGYGFRNMSSTDHCEAVANGQSDGSAGGGFGRISKAYNCHSRLNSGKSGHHLAGSEGMATGCSAEQEQRDGFLIDTSASQLVGCQAVHAGTLTDNTYSGFHLTSAADESLIEACVAWASTGSPSNHSKAGVTIDSGCSGAVVVGNKLKVPYGSGWGTAPIINNGTGTILSYPAHATYGDNFT